MSCVYVCVGVGVCDLPRLLILSILFGLIYLCSFSLLIVFLPLLPYSAIFGMGIRLDTTLTSPLRTTMTLMTMGKQVLEQVQTCVPVEKVGCPNVLVADYGQNPLCAHMITLLRQLGRMDKSKLEPVLENISVLMVSVCTSLYASVYFSIYIYICV